MSPSCLAPVDGIKGLVEEQPYRPTEVDPWWTILIQSGSIPEQSEEVSDDKSKTRKRDLCQND